MENNLVEMWHFAWWMKMWGFAFHRIVVCIDYMYIGHIYILNILFCIFIFCYLLQQQVLDYY